MSRPDGHTRQSKPRQLERAAKRLKLAVTTPEPVYLIYRRRDAQERFMFHLWSREAA